MTFVSFLKMFTNIFSVYPRVMKGRKSHHCHLETEIHQRADLAKLSVKTLKGIKSSEL